MICNSLKCNLTYFDTPIWLSHSVECRKAERTDNTLCSGLSGFNQSEKYTLIRLGTMQVKKKRNAPDRYLQMYNCVSCSLAQQREREREKARELKTRVHWKVRDKGEMCWSKSLSPRTFISTNYQIFPYLYLREADGLYREDGSEICKLQCFQSFCVHSLHFICSTVPGLG